MLKALFDAVMERRCTQLVAQVGEWLPRDGPVLDLGSGTGHLAARLERELGLDVVTADVSDMHVIGRPPVLVGDGTLPFEDETFAAALLVFMLAYPSDPPALLREVARATRGPIVVVQTLHASRAGYAWLRVREFVWTVVAFHVSKLVGYVPAEARFSMSTRRLYTAPALRRDVAAAGLRVRARRDRPVLPGRALYVAALVLERDA